MIRSDRKDALTEDKLQGAGRKQSSLSLGIIKWGGWARFLMRTQGTWSLETCPLLGDDSVSLTCDFLSHHGSLGVPVCVQPLALGHFQGY